MAEKKQFQKNKVKWIGIVALGLLLFYVLSEGLAYRLLNKKVMAQQTFSTIYRPIIYVCHHNEHIDHAFWCYENLWYQDKFSSGENFFRALDELNSTNSTKQP